MTPNISLTPELDAKSLEVISYQGIHRKFPRVPSNDYISHADNPCANEVTLSALVLPWRKKDLDLVYALKRMPIAAKSESRVLGIGNSNMGPNI